jgi:integrase
MACRAVPLVRRLFFGVLEREGMRREEAADLRWSDVDLARGVVRLDENKTDDPRAWSLDAGVAAALGIWRSRFRPTWPSTNTCSATRANPFTSTRWPSICGPTSRPQA